MSDERYLPRPLRDEITRLLSGAEFDPTHLVSDITDAARYLSELEPKLNKLVDLNIGAGVLIGDDTRAIQHYLEYKNF